MTKIAKYAKPCPCPYAYLNLGFAIDTDTNPTIRTKCSFIYCLLIHTTKVCMIII